MIGFEYDQECFGVYYADNNKYNCRMEEEPVAPVEKTPEQLE